MAGLLGRGGMADVYQGRDVRLGRTVAVKLLRADLARDPQFQARFRREAQAVAGLNHPSIVAVYDTGEQSTDDSPDGARVPFIVMEYVSGRTLRDLIRAKELTIDQAIEYTLGVLSALEYSHRAGIVHRDIKPANVMVTQEGKAVKVMDFGIARAIADSSATMTQTQAVIGTAQYLSPEQARGETVDARSDLYSAACLFYEMLTGRPPFVGDSPVSVAYQHVRETAEAPSHFNGQVSRALDSVVIRALQKNRGDRFQDAAAFRRALRAAKSGVQSLAAAGKRGADRPGRLRSHAGTARQGRTLARRAGRDCPLPGGRRRRTGHPCDGQGPLRRCADHRTRRGGGLRMPTRWACRRNGNATLPHASAAVPGLLLCSFSWPWCWPVGACWATTCSLPNRLPNRRW